MNEEHSKNSIIEPILNLNDSAFGIGANKLSDNIINLFGQPEPNCGDGGGSSCIGGCSGGSGQ